jgi:hypothetical protein
VDVALGAAVKKEGKERKVRTEAVENFASN